MKNARKLSIILTIIAVIVMLGGCNSKPEVETPVENNTADISKPVMNVATLKGPSGMSMATLMEQNELGETDIDYNFNIFGSPDEIVGKISTGEIDLAAVPSNLGATLNVKTDGNIKMIAVNSLGSLYILENGDSIKNLADLKGKTILSSGQGSTPEYILNHLLNQVGLKDKVTVEYVGEHTEVASKFVAGEADIIMVPEPFVTQILAKSTTTKVALNLTDVWKTTTQSELPMTAIIARADYVEENKKAVDIFRSEAGMAVDELNSNPTESAKLIEKFGIMPANIAEKALPNCNIVFITGSQIIEPMQAYFEILFNSNPKSVGGVMPTKDFYYVG